MTASEKEQILTKAKTFFKDTIVQNHIKNTEELNLSDFNTNPFLAKYLAYCLTGSSSPKDIAKALIYPRVLDTSITTSIETDLQKFYSTTLENYSSAIDGIDIEFIDAVDGRKKYCQIKAGPNTINQDEVVTIGNHFENARILARTNGINIKTDDLIVGVFYGSEKQLSDHYKEIHKTYPVFVGEEFWYRLTGDKNFYYVLIDSITDCTAENDCTKILTKTINSLSDEIQKNDSYNYYYR